MTKAAVISNNRRKWRNIKAISGTAPRRIVSFMGAAAREQQTNSAWRVALRAFVALKTLFGGNRRALARWRRQK
jgi:hypothetical protein